MFKCNFLVSILIFTLLSSCSLRSAYNDPKLRKNMSCVYITDSVGSQFEVELGQALEAVLPTEDCIGTRYNLIANINYQENPLILNLESDIVRQQLTANVHYQLQDAQTGQVVSQKNIMVVDSYNAFDVPYAAYVEERELKRNLAHKGAEIIFHQLLLYFTTLQEG